VAGEDNALDSSALPTPIARVASRLLTVEQLGPDQARELFDCSLYALEAYMKYSQAILLAGLRTHDEVRAYAIECQRAGKVYQ